MKVLVIIDMQKIFAKSDLEWYIPNIMKLWRNIKILEKQFLDSGNKVIYTLFEPPSYDINFYYGQWKKYYEKYPFAIYPNNKKLYNLISDPDPRAIIAPSVGTFGKMDAIKQYLDPTDDIYICGVSTSCCVLSTILSLVDQIYKIYLLQDYVAAGNRGKHNYGMNIIKNYGNFVKIV